MEDKIRGMFRGLALGDALGAPFEFRYSRSPLECTPEIQYPFTFQSQYQPKRTSVLGQVTDDTEMTLTLFRNLVQNQGRIDSRIRDYCEWATSASMVGRNTRDLFKGIKTVKGFEGRYQKKFEHHWKNSDYYSNPICEAQSNGSLMRCSPLALFDSEYWIQDCALTNPSRVNQEAQRIYLERMQAYLLGIDVPEIETEVPEIKQVLQHLHSDTPIPGPKGWVCKSLWFALHFDLQEYNSFSELLKDIVHLGGDTDTNAAIAGALIGAKLGWNKMSQDPVVVENWNTVVSADITQGDLPRPDKYSPKYFEVLIKQYIMTYITPEREDVELLF